ncbi:MAG: HalD/BesD family halogenase [Granulosicoccaceae bacterium]
MSTDSGIDLKRYPIDELAGKAYEALVAKVRDQLQQDGCAVLSGFATESCVVALREEADRQSQHAYTSTQRTNAYFGKDDPSLPSDHPIRRFFDRSNGFIPADKFSKQGTLRKIHDHPNFDRFVRDCLEAKNFYRYADPLADVIVNQAEAGNGFPWHFDTNNYTVTLAIQNAESGGEFEYAPNIRRDGENFEEVQAVLEERSIKVKRLTLEPGDLQLFKGRYSLHRVAPLHGQRKRYVAIFSYVEQPDMVGSPERTRQLYGRVLPIHLERAGLRADAYID